MGFNNIPYSTFTFFLLSIIELECDQIILTLLQWTSHGNNHEAEASEVKWVMAMKRLNNVSVFKAFSKVCQVDQKVNRL